MKTIHQLAIPVAVAVAALIVGAASSAGAETPKKNWTPPTAKIYAQALSDEIMAKHPELQSVTFHGVPPGQTKVYTMFAGSYPERIGNPDDPDDIDVIEKGITILDPRWHRVNDTVKRVVVQEPLRDKAGENIGLIVFAYKTAGGSKGERYYVNAAMDLRDALQRKIANYAALFAAAK
jgi:hypothetical protein